MYSCWINIYIYIYKIKKLNDFYGEIFKEISRKSWHAPCFTWERDLLVEKNCYSLVHFVLVKNCTVNQHLTRWLIVILNLEPSIFHGIWGMYVNQTAIATYRKLPLSNGKNITAVISLVNVGINTTVVRSISLH